MTVEEGQFFSPLPGTIDDFMYNFESFLVEPAVGLHLWCQLDRVNSLCSLHGHSKLFLSLVQITKNNCLDEVFSSSSSLFSIKRGTTYHFSN